MVATFRLDLFVICYNLLAVDGLKQKGKTGDFQVEQEIRWQQGQENIRRTEGLLAPEQQWPGVGLERRDESDFSLDLDLRNTEGDSQNSLPIGTTEPNAIAGNSENCQPPPIGGKERRAPPPETKLFCPYPATTDTDTPESGQQQQPPTTGNGGDQREGGQAPGGTPQGQPLVLPKLFRIPINDGDNPTCYDATNGLMPVGVCQNPQQSPEPSKYDIFMNRNIDIFPRAWKLIDSERGAFFLILISHSVLPNFICTESWFYN